MNRPKYKELYLKEKNRSSSFKHMLDLCINELKNFNLYVIDREQTYEGSFQTIRQIHVEQDDKHKFSICYDKEMLEGMEDEK